MPEFLYTAKNREGERVTERITSGNTSAARYALETRGYTDIQFQTDDMQAAINRAIGAKPPDENWTPEMENESRRRGGAWAHLWFAWKANAIFWLPLLILDVLVLLKGPPFSVGAWIKFALTLLFLVYFVCMVLPGVVFQLLLTASAWARWDDVGWWVRRIRLMKKFAAVPIPEWDMNMRHGFALASQGKLSEALHLVSQYESDPNLAKGLYYGRLASIYQAARDYRKMAELRALAVAQGTGSANELIDQAFGLVRYLRDAAGARKVLEQLEDKEITSLATPYIAFVKGMIAVEECNWIEAKARLQETLEKVKPFASQVLLTGFIAEANAYLAIALGNLGELAEAREKFQTARANLTAHRKTELILRCLEVTGR